MGDATEATERVAERARREADAYRGDNPRPLEGYTVVLGIYGMLVAQAGVTIRSELPSERNNTAASPSDLKPLITITGFGVSMKCAPSCSPIRRSSRSSRIRRQIFARRC